MTFPARSALLMALAALAAGLGLLLASCGESESDDDQVAGVIHRLLLAAGTEGTTLLESFPGALPDDLPAEPPLYPDATVLVSNRQPAPVSNFEEPAPTPGATQSILYFVVLDTDDSRAEVFEYYEEALEEDPWQIQSTFSTEQLDTLQFFSTDDLDLGGVVSIAEGGADNRTTILISLQDAGASLDDEPEFELQSSLPLPAEFPPDVPVFEGATLTGTAFFRDPGIQSFLVVFLTESGQDEVIDFYREAFQANGWTVQDTTPFAGETRIDFHDADNQIQGDITADRFVRDRRYTEVTLQIQTDPAREPVDPDAVPGEDEPEATAETP